MIRRIVFKLMFCILAVLSSQSVWAARKLGQFSIHFPEGWVRSREVAAGTAVFRGPKLHDFHPTFYITYIGSENAAYALDSKQRQSDFVDQKRKWAASNKAVIEKVLPFEPISKTSEGVKIFSTGVVYSQDAQKFTERAYFLSCKGDVYSAGSLSNEAQESKKISDTISNAIRSFVCQ
jgi:hypothetical protein